MAIVTKRNSQYNNNVLSIFMDTQINYYNVTIRTGLRGEWLSRPLLISYK